MSVHFVSLKNLLPAHMFVLLNWNIDTIPGLWLQLNNFFERASIDLLVHIYISPPHCIFYSIRVKDGKVKYFGLGTEAAPLSLSFLSRCFLCSPFASALLSVSIYIYSFVRGALRLFLFASIKRRSVFLYVILIYLVDMYLYLYLLRERDNDGDLRATTYPCSKRF